MDIRREWLGGQESNSLSHGWLKQTAMYGRVGASMRGKDLTISEECRKCSADLVSFAEGELGFAHLF